MQALKGQNDTSPLIGMELSDLRDALGPEQPSFRARQVFDALYRQQVADLSQISTLPQVLRQQLLTSFQTGLPVIEKLAPHERFGGQHQVGAFIDDGR